MKLTVEINNPEKAMALAHFLKANGYDVLSENIPLSDDDWITSGRPATDEEIEQLAVKMENDPVGEEADIVFDRILKKFSA